MESKSKHEASLGELELQPTREPAIENPTTRLNPPIEETSLTKRNLFKVLAASISFFFAGNNDGSLGALTPYILRTYNVGTEYVALIYGATFLGWLFAAAKNSHLIRYLNLGAILTLGAFIQLLAHTLRCWTPPCALYVITFFFQATGMAYNESHANTFVASIDGAHRLLGFIHAMYALGCLISPFVATAIAARGMSIGSKLFLKEIQTTALGFVFVLAQAGGSFFPAVTGIIVSEAGVRVMQPVLVGLIVSMGISWALVPKVKKRNE
ncbi:FucP Fucose permease [Pyrenophora tritici-repentis]|nr:FucP Fucose permease [Pyrenophora tritici-repentis]